jgi:hypothetical protein
MSRTNFGRVSGVIIDVCRPHGAWFDRGELGAIRRFLRQGGLQRYERSRRIDRELHAPPQTARHGPKDGSLDDVYDVLVGGDGGWDVPSRIPRLLVAAVFGALGALLLWSAFDRGARYGRYREDLVVLGLLSLYVAGRALWRWAERRRG